MKQIQLRHLHVCMLQSKHFPGKDLEVMRNLWVLLSGSVLTCDIYRIENNGRRFCCSLCANSALKMYLISAEIGPAATSPYAGSLVARQ